jgi:hypothetical protein
LDASPLRKLLTLALLMQLAAVMNVNKTTDLEQPTSILSQNGKNELKCSLFKDGELIARDVPMPQVEKQILKADRVHRKAGNEPAIYTATCKKLPVRVGIVVHRQIKWIIG